MKAKRIETDKSKSGRTASSVLAVSAGILRFTSTLQRLQETLDRQGQTIAALHDNLATVSVNVEKLREVPQLVSTAICRIGSLNKTSLQHAPIGQPVSPPVVKTETRVRYNLYSHATMASKDINEDQVMAILGTPSAYDIVALTYRPKRLWIGGNSRDLELLHWSVVVRLLQSSHTGIELEALYGEVWREKRRGRKKKGDPRSCVSSALHDLKRSLGLVKKGIYLQIADGRVVWSHIPTFALIESNESYRTTNSESATPEQYRSNTRL